MSSEALQPEKFTYSVEEACAATSLGTTKLYELLKDGKLEAKVLGRRTMITRASLQRYIDSLPAWKPQQRMTPRRNIGPKHP